MRGKAGNGALGVDRLVLFQGSAYSRDGHLTTTSCFRATGSSREGEAKTAQSCFGGSSWLDKVDFARVGP